MILMIEVKFVLTLRLRSVKLLEVVFVPRRQGRLLKLEQDKQFPDVITYPLVVWLGSNRGCLSPRPGFLAQTPWEEP